VHVIHSPRIRCPSCHDDTIGDILCVPWAEPGPGADTADEKPFVIETPDGPVVDGCCASCGAGLLFGYRDGMVLPTVQPSPTSERIPEPAHSFMHQAKYFALSGIWKVGACFARRAVRAACVERGAKYGDIVFQIETLANRGAVARNFGAWARATPVIAYDGSDPEDCVTTIEEARTAVKGAERFLEALYR
jgi:hypothetical protein